MNIGSIGSASSYIAQAAPRAAESAEPAGAPDHDGDSDNGGSAAVSTAAAASVNTSGQIVGQSINVKA